MSRILARVFWRAVNPEAVSALITLRDTMSMPVIDIAVSSLFTFEIDDSVEDPSAYVKKILLETGIFYNPNRDSYEFINDLKDLPSNPSKVDLKVRWALVWGGEENETELGNKLRERYGFTGVSKVSRARLWRLELSAKDNAEADELLGEIVETKSRTSGLLVNPHSQNWKMV